MTLPSKIQKSLYDLQLKIRAAVCTGVLKQHAEFAVQF